MHYICSTNASKFSDINECSSNPCLNGGACVDQVNGYVCNCLAGYTGVICQNGKYYFICYKLFSRLGTIRVKIYLKLGNKKSGIDITA